MSELYGNSSSGTPDIELAANCPGFAGHTVIRMAVRPGDRRIKMAKAKVDELKIERKNLEFPPGDGYEAPT
jgi:hypothetical protein